MQERQRAHSTSVDQRTYSDEVLQGATTYGEKLVRTAQRFLGYKSIRWKDTPDADKRGRTPEEGFDCSGFITYLLESV